MLSMVILKAILHKKIEKTKDEDLRRLANQTRLDLKKE